jgi:hypothetical protein
MNTSRERHASSRNRGALLSKGRCTAGEMVALGSPIVFHDCRNAAVFVALQSVEASLLPGGADRREESRESW